MMSDMEMEGGRAREREGEGGGRGGTVPARTESKRREHEVHLTYACSASSQVVTVSRKVQALGSDQTRAQVAHVASAPRTPAVTQSVRTESSAAQGPSSCKWRGSFQARADWTRRRERMGESFMVQSTSDGTVAKGKGLCDSGSCELPRPQQPIGSFFPKICFDIRLFLSY